MSFDEALAGNAWPSRLGDSALKFEGALLVIEARKGGTVIPSLWRAGAAAFGIGALALLTLDVGPAWGALFVVAFALCLWRSEAEKRFENSVRRSVFDFARGTVRFDVPERRRGRAVTKYAALDDFGAVERTGSRVVLVAKAAGPLIVVDGVRKNEDADAARFVELLSTSLQTRVDPSVDGGLV